MDKQLILKEVIKGHRLLLEERYDYHRIKSNYNIPSFFSAERVIPIKEYFLNYIYPDLEKRQELDQAFAHLDQHVKHPEQLGRIVLDSAGLIFKFGRHLPKIFMAGIKALKSFRSASRVEQLLTDQAGESGMQPPYSVKDIKILLSQIPQKELDQLVDNSVALYGLLFDEKLVNRIVAMMDHLIVKMIKRPKVYPKEEVTGIKLGRTILSEGTRLVSVWSDSEQAQLAQLLEEIERDAILELSSLRTA